MKTKGGIIEAAMKHRQIVILIVSLMFFLGIYALIKMPKQEFPVFTVRQGVVIAVYPGATSDEVEEQVTKPLEDFIFEFKEVKKSKTHSLSRDGMAIVFVELNDDITDKMNFGLNSNIGLRLLNPSCRPGYWHWLLTMTSAIRQPC